MHLTDPGSLSAWGADVSSNLPMAKTLQKEHIYRASGILLQAAFHTLLGYSQMYGDNFIKLSQAV